LAEAGVLSERFCAVHAIHLTDAEVRLLAEGRASACVCPTTERDLGDGLVDLQRLRAHGVLLSVGVDSHVVTDHLEEVRALETHERLRLCRRVTFQPLEGRTLAEQLVLEGSAHGARALGFDVAVAGHKTSWLPNTMVPLSDQPALAGVADDELLDAVVFSGTGLRFERDAAGATSKT
jgi:cytosine/adenosine deaminase-related metal-dependent hydrolase